MGTFKLGRYTKSGLKKALAAGVCTGVLGGGAVAQIVAPSAPLKMQNDFLGYALSVSARGGYSDNINLQRGANRDSEYFASTLISGGVIVSTPRVTAVALADVDFSYLVDRKDFVVNQNVGATSTFTAVDDLLYFDVSGQTSRQLVGDNAKFSGNLNAARNQRTNVHSFALSPYIFRPLPDRSAVSARYRYSQVFIDDSQSGFNLPRRGLIDESVSHEVSAVYDTGAKLGNLNVKLGVSGNETNETGSVLVPDFKFRQGTATAEIEAAISRNYAITGAVGYDEIDTTLGDITFFNDDELSGIFWRAGILAQPNRTSFVRLEYGERYNDQFINANVSYQLTSRITLAARAARVFQTRAQGVNNRLNVDQGQLLQFADRLRQGVEISPRGVIKAANSFAGTLSGRGAQTIGVSVTDQAAVILTSVHGKNRFGLVGNYSDSDFGFRQVESFAARMNFQRDFSRRLTGTVTANFRRVDSAFDPAACIADPVIFGFDPTDPSFDAPTDCALLAANNGVTNSIIGRVGLSYSLYENVSAFAEYSHTERFSPVDLLEFSENAAIVGLIMDF